jgi:hypothetical protein
MESNIRCNIRPNIEVMCVRRQRRLLHSRLSWFGEELTNPKSELSLGISFFPCKQSFHPSRTRPRSCTYTVTVNLLEVQLRQCHATRLLKLSLQYMVSNPMISGSTLRSPCFFQTPSCDRRLVYMIEAYTTRYVWTSCRCGDWSLYG